MTILARDLILIGMQLVAECNRLFLGCCLKEAQHPKQHQSDGEKKQFVTNQFLPKAILPQENFHTQTLKANFMRVLAHIFFRKPIKIVFNEQAISEERGNFKNEKNIEKTP